MEWDQGTVLSLIPHQGGKTGWPWDNGSADAQALTGAGAADLLAPVALLSMPTLVRSPMVACSNMANTPGVCNIIVPAALGDLRLSSKFAGFSRADLLQAAAGPRRLTRTAASGHPR